jgi:hypothetical protein
VQEVVEAELVAAGEGGGHRTMMIGGADRSPPMLDRAPGCALRLIHDEIVGYSPVCPGSEAHSGCSEPFHDR